MFEVCYAALDGVGKLLSGDVEPQCNSIACGVLWVVDNLIRGYRIKLYLCHLGVCCAEVEHCLVAVEALLATQRLARKAAVHKHAEVELWLCRGVVAQRVVPDGEAWHLHGVVCAVEKSNLVHRGLILHISVRILKGVDAVVHGLEVLRDEDTVLLGAGDDLGLILEHRRVPLVGALHAVGDEEVDERLAHRVRLHGICRIARHIHRVDLWARREDIAHGVQRVRLVVVLNRRAEVDGVGGVGA